MTFVDTTLWVFFLFTHLPSNVVTKEGMLVCDVEIGLSDGLKGGQRNRQSSLLPVQ